MSCSLCGSDTDVAAFDVPPESIDACSTCRTQIVGDLDPKHWFCLQESIWSEVPAVQVLSWRLLHRLSDPWAVELLESAWLEDDTLAWAKEGLPVEDDEPPTVDSNGTRLADGDSVTLIRDLDVKGAGFTAKRGTLVKNIRLVEGDVGHIEGKVNKTAIFLKTQFLKKA
ncbi:MAG: PhnA domain protein [Proteobacteria bacterium]|nr:PhnA domain protein [Pseudomonadota bacterium]